MSIRNTVQKIEKTRFAESQPSQTVEHSLGNGLHGTQSQSESERQPEYHKENKSVQVGFHEFVIKRKRNWRTKRRNRLEHFYAKSNEREKGAGHGGGYKNENDTNCDLVGKKPLRCSFAVIGTQV